MNGEVPLAMKAVSDEIVIADVDTLRMPVAIAPGLAGEPINAEVANKSGTVQVSELTSLSITSRGPDPVQWTRCLPNGVRATEDRAICQ